MKFIKAWPFFFLITLLLLFTSSCQKRQGDNPLEEAKENQQLVVAVQSDAKTLDPHLASDVPSMRFIENMYSTLLRYGKDYGDVELDLARDYRLSRQGKMYTFFLKKGVRFHQTERELTSRDVKYSIQRIQKLKVRSSHFDQVNSIETPDPYTVIFHLKRPFAPFLTYLAHPMNAIVDRQVVESKRGLATQDGGTGPFMLKHWQKDRELLLIRNPHYHEKNLPYLNRVAFRPYSNATSRLAALRKGEVQMILQLEAKDQEFVKGFKDIKVQSVPGTFWEYLGFNTHFKPLRKAKVRRALSLALDRKILNQVVKFSKATPLFGGPIPSAHWASSHDQIYQDPQIKKAKQLLSEAGFPGGFEVTLKVGSSFPYQVDAATVIKQQLKKIGVHIKIEALESNLFFHDLGRKNFHMTVVGWLGFVDPDEWFANIFHSEGPWNQQGYSNKKLDQLIEKGRLTSDRLKRKKIYQEIQKILLEDSPMAFLYLNEQTAAFHKNVKNYTVHATGTTLFLREAKFSKEDR